MPLTPLRIPLRRRIKRLVAQLTGKAMSPELQGAMEQHLLMTGRLMAETLAAKQKISSLREVEFKVFSQWGDDGIIQWLIRHIEGLNPTFIEFGVSDYREANTRFLMINNNWSGLVMDGSPANVAEITNAWYFWQYHLQARAAFITCENINDLLRSTGFSAEIGLLHIDLDGNDYWIWQAIDAISPAIVILEYNSVFGPERAVTIPYRLDFIRTRGHCSNLYYGASLAALQRLSAERGYAFIGCNDAGNNAYFVQRSRLNQTVREITLRDGFVASRFRESRDARGRLTFLSGSDRLAAIRGLPVHNVVTGEIEPL